MRILKRVVKRTLATLGYEVRPLEGSGIPVVSFENFKNLATAYETRLNSGHTLIPSSEVRPRLLARLLGTPPSEAYFIVQALAECREVPGDVCEFGVAQGETSALIANEMASQVDKRLHLFDSFAGLPMPSDKDKLKDDIFSLGSIEAYAGTMACPESMVRSHLEALSFPRERYVIHKGFIERVIHEDKNLPSQVSCAYVDFDFYEPITIALRFLHTTTRPGAVIIVDDYDFFSTGVKAAVDEFVGANATYDLFLPDSHYGKFARLTRKA